MARGRVQGVGYRWFTRDAAVAHCVGGWVRNCRDGSVEAELHGSDADIRAVLESMNQGPAGAHVDEIAVTDVSRTVLSGFEIRATA